MVRGLWCWSGDDLEQFDLEDQRRASRDCLIPLVAVGEIGRTHEASLSADFHLLEPLRPARDDTLKPYLCHDVVIFVKKTPQKLFLNERERER